MMNWVFLLKLKLILVMVWFVKFNVMINLSFLMGFYFLFVIFLNFSDVIINVLYDFYFFVYCDVCYKIMIIYNFFFFV